MVPILLLNSYWFKSYAYLKYCFYTYIFNVLFRSKNSLSNIKKQLPVVTAVTVVDLPTGPILLKINEAVYNKSAEHSLLSDFQLREMVKSLNAVSKRHGGSQELEINDKVRIPLTMKHCMLTFNIRPPTSDEARHLHPIPITQDGTWRPRTFLDDPAEEFQRELDALDNADEEIYTEQAVLHTQAEPTPKTLHVSNIHLSLRDNHPHAETTEPEEIRIPENYPSPVYT